MHRPVNLREVADTKPRPAEVILVRSFDRRTRGFRKAWRRARSGWSDTSAHELRVSARRLLAMIEILSCILPDEDIAEVRLPVKKFLARLGPIRDHQIVRQYVDSSLPNYSVLLSFRKFLRRREEKEMSKFRKYVERKDQRALHTSLADLRDRLLLATRRTGSAVVEDRLVSAVERDFALLIQQRQRCDGISMAKMHRLRLAFKRFRYAVEAMKPLVTGIGKSELKPLRKLQTALGDVQDLEVVEAHLKDWSRRQGSPARHKLSAIYKRIGRTRQERMADAFVACDAVEKLWRNARGDDRQLRLIPGGQD